MNITDRVRDRLTSLGIECARLSVEAGVGDGYGFARIVADWFTDKATISGPHTVDDIVSLSVAVISRSAQKKGAA